VDALLTTTFGALLGQVMPFQLGVALARWFAGKFGVGPSAGLSLGATLYEQLFDAIILLAAALVSILGLALRPGPIGWLALILCSAAFVATWTSAWFSPILVMVGRCLDRIPAGKAPKSMLEFQAALKRMAGFSPWVLRRLAVLSILRYGTTLAWIAIVMGALRMWNFVGPMAIGLPLITAIGIVPITPGSLGVTEWTWSAILLSAGATMGAAGLFALTMRIVNIGALLMLIGLLATVLPLRGLSAMLRWRKV
jgi:hypothetical protein